MPHPTPIFERLEWEKEQEEFRRSLPPSPYPDYLFGLKPQPPDPRNWNAAKDSILAANLRAGTAPEGDILKYRKGPSYSQGGVPACVSHTAAAGASLFQQKEESLWRTFNAMGLHNETGPANEGRYPVDILKHLVEKGIAEAGSENRYKLAGYAFVDPGSLWVPTIEAALSDERPVWICLLLPSNFSYESSGSATSGYHEVCIVGWRPTAFLIWNSWGDSWGQSGLGWLPKEYLQADGNQKGLCQAHVPTDEILGPKPDPKPDPEPKPRPDPEPLEAPLLTARASGGGLEFLRPGIRLAASGEGFSGDLDVTDVKRPEPKPEPEPQPVEELTLSHYTRRLFRNRLAVWVTVKEGNNFVDATVTGWVNDAEIGKRLHTASGVPATFGNMDAPVGSKLKFQAVSGGGKIGTLDLSAPGSLYDKEPPEGWEEFL